MPLRAVFKTCLRISLVLPYFFFDDRLTFMCHVRGNRASGVRFSTWSCQSKMIAINVHTVLACEVLTRQGGLLLTMDYDFLFLHFLVCDLGSAFHA